MRNWGSLLLSIAIAIVLAFFAITPPKTQSSDAPLAEFSSARAMVDVREIARFPHPTGSDDNTRVRAYLSQRLEELGLEVSQSEGLIDERALKRLNRWSGQAKTEQNFINIMGVLPGKNPERPALLLMAHHDTVWGSPGAADATIGLSSILEILRAVQSEGQAERNIIVLFTDAEELGLNGARQFFAQNPLRDSIGAVINFEARGGGGTANMFQTSAANGAAAKLFARHVKQPSASSLSTFIYSVLPNDTDLTPALEKDYTAYNIANIGAAKYYHSPKITADALDERSLQHMGSQGLDLSRALLSAEAFPAKTPDAAFFDLYGFTTIIFAPFWGWVFLALTAIGLTLSFTEENRVRQTVNGALRMLVFLVGGGAALFGLNVLSGGGAGADYYDRLAAIPLLELMTAALCFAAFLGIFGQKPLTQNGQVGAVIPLFVIALVAQFYAPTAAYFLTLPLLLCAIVLLSAARGPNIMFKALAIILGALVMGYVAGLGHLLMLGVGPDLPSTAILLAALALIFIMPLFCKLPKWAALTAAFVALAVSFTAALWIRLDPIAATVPLY